MPESLTLAENYDMAGIIGCVQCGRPLPKVRAYEHFCSVLCQKAMDAYIERYRSQVAGGIFLVLGLKRPGA